MNKRIPSTDQLAPSLTIETLEEIVRNCQRNEQRLQELERDARRERKKVERLLREKSSAKQEQQRQLVKFFITLDNDTTARKETPPSSRQSSRGKPRRSINMRERQKRVAATSSHAPRVRFDLPTECSGTSADLKLTVDTVDEFDELARQCEDLLLRLRIHHRNPATLLSNSRKASAEQCCPTRSQSNRPQNSFHGEQKHQQAHPLFHSAIEDTKQTSNNAREPLSVGISATHDSPISEIQRRNHLRAEILRLRLRQHLLLPGRPNVNPCSAILDA